MGTICSVACGAVTVLCACIIWSDEWVDDNQRWMALAIGLVLGGGTILHEAGVW